MDIMTIKRANRRQKFLPDSCLPISFDDGRSVIYGVKETMRLPGYQQLFDVVGSFQQVQLDESRTCVYWNDKIDLPSDTIYEYEKSVAGGEPCW